MQAGKYSIELTRKKAGCDWEYAALIQKIQEDTC